MPDAADDAAAGAADTSSNRAPTSTGTTSTSTTAKEVKVVLIMTDETAAALGVPHEEVVTMQEQRKRLQPHVILSRGLSDHTIEVGVSEAQYCLDLKQRKADGHVVHAGGSRCERSWPWSITSDGGKKKSRRALDGRLRVYGPMGGPASEHKYDKQPLEIKGASELHGAVAHVIVGVRSQQHCDKRVHTGKVGVLGQLKGHVAYCIKGPDAELHIHRMPGDVQLFTEDIARGAFQLCPDADGFLNFRLLDDKGVSPHGAIAVDCPRIPLRAQHVIKPEQEPLQVLNCMPKEAYITLSVSLGLNPNKAVLIENINEGFQQLQPRQDQPPLDLLPSHLLDVIAQGCNSGVYMDNPNGSSYPKLTSEQA